MAFAREEFAKRLLEALKLKMENHNGLYIFAKQRAKFEGWLKAEMCEILKGMCLNVAVEKDRIDIVCNDWALELKTINTSYRYDNVEKRTKPITDNIKSVLSDISKLQEKINYGNKAILFVVFPCKHDNKYWKGHLEKIAAELTSIWHTEFKFKTTAASQQPEPPIPGIIYFGVI